MRINRAARAAAVAASVAVAVGAVSVVATSGPGREPASAHADHDGERQASPGERAGGSRPNVVLITVDDLAEGDLAYMPHTRELLQDQGTTLDQGLAPTPICAPARASLLTGQYAHHHGVTTIDGPRGGFPAFRDKKTLPTWLRTAGYDTMFVGKYVNGYGVKDPHYIPPGWTHWRGSVDWSTYSFFQTRFNMDGRIVQPPGYSTNIISDFSSDLIREHEKGRHHRKPYFMWVNYVAPHHGGPQQSDDPPRSSGLQTTTPAPRDRNSFSGVPIPWSPSLWEKNVHGNRFADKPKGATYRAEVQELWEQRVEAVQAVDRAVQKTVRTLRRTGELRHTVIWLTSDNGFLTGEHNKVGKLVFYDRSLNIPMILRGPGIPKGRHVGTPVTNPDVPVTIAALAGARPTRRVDGEDVLPWLTQPNHDRIIPIEGYPVHNGTHRLYSGIRYGDLTYIRGKGHEELYDRSVDPGELTNRAGQARYHDVLLQMRAWNKRYRNCTGASCPRLEDAPQL